jgi:hypothetical protein
MITWKCSLIESPDSLKSFTLLIDDELLCQDHFRVKNIQFSVKVIVHGERNLEDFEAIRIQHKRGDELNSLRARRRLERVLPQVLILDLFLGTVSVLAILTGKT